MNQDIQSIVDALKCIRVPAVPGEYDLHEEIDAALSAADIAHHHEYSLGAHCRIDFLAGRIGIEVKKGRPAPRALRQQVSRYLSSQDLDALIVVTQHAVSLPHTSSGKPVVQVSLNRLWGVALP